MRRQNKRKKSGTRTFLILLLEGVLVLAIIFVGLQAIDASNTFKREAAVTPTASITPRPVSVTRNPVLPSPSPTAVMLRSGVKDDSVKSLQEALAALGYYTDEIDGQFGPGTKSAVTLFQAQHNLSVDGVAGPATLAKLNSADAHAVVYTDVLAGDKPLLVNRTHTVDRAFIPKDLVNMRDVCPSDVVSIKGSDIMGNETAVDALVTMLRAAQADGVKVWQISAGHRSYAYQQSLFDKQVKAYMDAGQTRESATSSTRLTVAPAGASEHHTGLAFDVTVPDVSFAGTAQHKWLTAHCWEYGFIMRYQADKEDKTGYIAEAWHIRYVGLPHSTLMRDQSLCLEEYLAQSN